MGDVIPAVMAREGFPEFICHQDVGIWNYLAGKSFSRFENIEGFFLKHCPDACPCPFVFKMR